MIRKVLTRRQLKCALLPVYSRLFPTSFFERGERGEIAIGRSWRRPLLLPPKGRRGRGKTERYNVSQIRKKVAKKEVGAANLQARTDVS